MINEESQRHKPMGLGISVIFFGIPAILLYLATHIGVPLLHKLTGIPVVVCWFISGGTLVFIPLFLCSLIFQLWEGNTLSFVSLRKRFRLKQMSFRDSLWGIGSVIVIGILTTIIITAAQKMVPSFSAQPSFMEMKPLSEDTKWILFAWLPFFFFNIVGEELFWRGYIFPRQELVFGKWTWLLNGALWWVFHISFGINLMVTLVPIIFITTYVVQKTKNTYIGMLIHGLLNGLGFISVAFGLI